MNNLVIKLLSLSLSATIIIFILLAIKPFVKRNLSKTWQYYIWLAVLFRLLIPFTPETSLMNLFYNLLEQKSYINSVSQYLPKNELVIYISEYVGIFWLIIVFVIILKKVICYNKYIYYLKSTRKLVSDSGVIEIYNEVCKNTSRRKRPISVSLYTHQYISSPMLIGFFKPYILLPNAMLCYNERMKYIFLHELTHCRRKDFLYKFFFQMISTIYFFHPLIYFVGKEINKNCELSCDEAVIQFFNKEEKKEYGSTLVDTLELVQANQSSTFLSSYFCDSTKHIKDRLIAISCYKQSSSVATITSFFITAIIIFCSLYIGVFKNIFNPNTCRCLENIYNLF
jgi:beta-lactamase regulating signal transducer with metallopeptidase domain